MSPGTTRWLVALTLAGMLAARPPGASAAMEHGGSGGAGMVMHHLHTLMNHGLSMLVQGSNLLMTAKMGMAPAMDTPTIRHGREMMREGTALLRQALDGPEMGEMMRTHAKDPLMLTTHQLGSAMLAVANLLEMMTIRGMEPQGKSGRMSPDEMTLHHAHILLNHALGMAAEGSNLVMLGQMGMAGTVDRVTVEHGRGMLREARTLWTDAVEGAAMQDLHARGVTPDASAMMAETHELAGAAGRVMEMLATMPVIDGG